MPPLIYVLFLGLVAQIQSMFSTRVADSVSNQTFGWGELALEVEILLLTIWPTNDALMDFEFEPFFKARKY